MSSESGAAIEFVGVSKSFGDGAPAIGHLDLSIESGELVTFVGPSGCGKTTTLRLINRLIEPSGGTISVGGREVTSVPVEELRRDIGYVIQQVGLFPHRTIAQNIATVPKLLGWSKPEITERVEELVDLVGLDRSLLTRHPAALSGGQQQRVAIARALAVEPHDLAAGRDLGAGQVEQVNRSPLRPFGDGTHGRCNGNAVGPEIRGFEFGFRVLGQSRDGCHADGYTQHRLHKPGTERAITFSTLDYVGRLRVTDPERFRAALFGGIGHARGFGCGLLLVRRV